MDETDGLTMNDIMWDHIVSEFKKIHVLPWMWNVVNNLCIFVEKCTYGYIIIYGKEKKG